MYDLGDISKYIYAYDVMQLQKWLNLLNAPIVLLMMALIRYADHCGDESILPELPWMH